MEKINFKGLLKLRVTDEPDADYYTCPLCRDTGWQTTERGVIPCSCQEEQHRDRRKLYLGLTPRLQQKTFDNFSLEFYPEYLKNEQGATYRTLSEKSFRACRDFAESYAPEGFAPGIILLGDTGVGKTHLAAATAGALIERGINCLFVVVPEFLDELRYSYTDNGSDKEEQLMRRAQTAPVLVLDDICVHNYSEWTRSKLYTLINYRLNFGLPLLITSNKDFDEMSDIVGARASSRLLESCDIYRLDTEIDIRSLNYKQRRAQS